MTRPSPLPHLLFCAGLAFGYGLAQPGRDERPQAAAAPTGPGPGAYQARILRVIDGDTVEARVGVWIGQEIVTKVRLRGVDAPELGGGCASSRGLAEQARARLEGLLGNAPVVLSEIGPDRYFGRVLARLTVASGAEAGETLHREGLARRYRGGRREGWC